MPVAPAAICIFPISGILCVLMWGRFPIPCRERWACTRRMLSRMTSRSTVTTGVSRSASAVIGSFLEGGPAVGPGSGLLELRGEPEQRRLVAEPRRELDADRHTVAIPEERH